MKVRTIAGTALGARLTVLCWGVLTLLAPVAVSACSPSSSSTPSSTFTTKVVTNTAPATGSATAPAAAHSTPAGGTASPVTPGVTATSTVTQTTGPTATSTVTQTTGPTPTATVTQTASVPAAPPVTGGGGTAGLQDGLLFGAGAAAILAGAGSIAYRRRVTRRR